MCDTPVVFARDRVSTCLATNHVDRCMKGTAVSQSTVSRELKASTPTTGCSLWPWAIRHFMAFTVIDLSHSTFNIQPFLSVNLCGVFHTFMMNPGHGFIFLSPQYTSLNVTEMLQWQLLGLENPWTRRHRVRQVHRCKDKSDLRRHSSLQHNWHPGSRRFSSRSNHVGIGRWISINLIILSSIYLTNRYCRRHRIYFLQRQCMYMS